MEGLKPLFLEQVFAVVRDWSEREGFDLWPADDSEKKKKFIEFCFENGLLTLLSDSQNRLEGFLFFYRSNQYEGCPWERLEMTGRFVVCDVFWIRPGASKDAADRLIRKAVEENSVKLMGAEKIVFFRAWKNYQPVIYDWPKFYRKFNGKRRLKHNTATERPAIDNGYGSERNRGQGP